MALASSVGCQPVSAQCSRALRGSVPVVGSHAGAGGSLAEESFDGGGSVDARLGPLPEPHGRRSLGEECSFSPVGGVVDHKLVVRCLLKSERGDASFVDAEAGANHGLVGPRRGLWSKASRVRRSLAIWSVLTADRPRGCGQLVGPGPCPVEWREIRASPTSASGSGRCLGTALKGKSSAQPGDGHGEPVAADELGVEPAGFS